MQISVIPEATDAEQQDAYENLLFTVLIYSHFPDHSLTFQIFPDQFLIP